MSEFLGRDGAQVAMLDDGTGAVAVYAVYSSAGRPVRVLVVNSQYFDGTGTRASGAVQLTGLAAARGTRQAKRMTAPSAVSQVGAAATTVTIGASASFGADCSRSGVQRNETVAVSASALSVTVQASEALIVFL